VDAFSRRERRCRPGHVLLNCLIARLSIKGESPTRDALGSGATVDWVHRVVGRLLHVFRDSGVEELPLGTGVIGAVFLVVVVNVNPRREVRMLRISESV
jgi:hypothetical protein